jgi:polyisoprenoid-binding protein YceI
VKRILLLLVLACAGAMYGSDTVVDLNPANTEIAFTVSDPLHTVRGTFKLKRGNIRFDPESGKASGEIVIDVTSGASGSGMRDRRMHKDILESQKYPEAVFTANRVDGRLGQPEVDVHGKMNMHGADHEMTLHFKVTAEGGQYTVITHFTIPYVQWGMKNPSNFILKVGDKVEVDVKARF